MITLQFHDFLVTNDASKQFCRWASDKEWVDFHNKCPHAEWLLWVFIRTNPRNKRAVVNALANCVNNILEAHECESESHPIALEFVMKYVEYDIDEIPNIAFRFASAYSYDPMDKALNLLITLTHRYDLIWNFAPESMIEEILLNLRKESMGLVVNFEESVRKALPIDLWNTPALE